MDFVFFFVVVCSTAKRIVHFNRFCLQFIFEFGKWEPIRTISPQIGCFCAFDIRLTKPKLISESQIKVKSGRCEQMAKHRRSLHAICQNSNRTINSFACLPACHRHRHRRRRRRYSSPFYFVFAESHIFCCGSARPHVFFFFRSSSFV